jgi:hypothetical protein
MMNGKQTKLLQQYQRAILDMAFEYIVGIVYTFREPVDGSKVHVGSGFCATIEGQQGWITARHIIDSMRRESSTGNLAGNALLFGQADVGINVVKLAKQYFDQARVVCPDSSLDVAFVTLPGQAMQKMMAVGMKHIEVGRACSTSEVSAGIYAAFGFAAQGSSFEKEGLMKYVSDGRTHQLSRVRLEGVGMQSVFLVSSLDTPRLWQSPPELDSAIREHTMFPAVELQDAKGMSGGPILYFDYGDANLAEFRLHGIQSRQSKIGQRAKSMTFSDARYAFETLRPQLAD